MSEHANLLHHIPYTNVCLVAPPCSAQRGAKIVTQPRVSSREQSYRAGGEGRAESQKKVRGVRKVQIYYITYYTKMHVVAPPCSAQKDAKIATQPRVSSRERSYRAGGEGRAECMYVCM